MLEICYTLRFFERNGRSSESPWSLRQTGIYQQMCRSSGKSTWIILQPSSRIQEQVRKAAAADQSKLSLQAIQLHRTFIASGLNTFGDYIEDLQSNVMKLVCFLCNLLRRMIIDILEGIQSFLLGCRAREKTRLCARIL